MQCARSVFARLRAKGIHTISVKKTPQCTGFLGGSVWPPTKDKETVTLDEVLSALEAAARMVVFR
eukprot:13590923-Alexandrium_andersonii.AAC.1